MRNGDIIMGNRANDALFNGAGPARNGPRIVDLCDVFVMYVYGGIYIISQVLVRDMGRETSSPTKGGIM